MADCRIQSVFSFELISACIQIAYDYVLHVIIMNSFSHLLKTYTMEIIVIFEVMKYMFILIVDKREKELSESSEKGTGVFNLKV